MLCVVYLMSHDCNVSQTFIFTNCVPEEGFSKEQAFKDQTFKHLQENGSCYPQLIPFSLRTFRLQKTPRTDIYFCLSANIISRYQIQKRGKNKKQFARIAEGSFLGAQIFFAPPYTWFERLVPSQGKATKKSGEYEGMVERIQNS